MLNTSEICIEMSRLLNLASHVNGREVKRLGLALTQAPSPDLEIKLLDFMSSVSPFKIKFTLYTSSTDDVLLLNKGLLKSLTKTIWKGDTESIRRKEGRNCSLKKNKKIFLLNETDR